MDTIDDVQMTNSVIANGNGEEMDSLEATYAERLTKMKWILSGETPIHLILQFLYSHNRYVKIFQYIIAFYLFLII